VLKINPSNLSLRHKLFCFTLQTRAFPEVPSPIYANYQRELNQLIKAREYVGNLPPDLQKTKDAILYTIESLQALVNKYSDASMQKRQVIYTEENKEEIAHLNEARIQALQNVINTKIAKFIGAGLDSMVFKLENKYALKIYYPHKLNLDPEPESSFSLQRYTGFNYETLVSLHLSQPGLYACSNLPTFYAAGENWKLSQLIQEDTKANLTNINYDQAGFKSVDPGILNEIGLFLIDAGGLVKKHLFPGF
jgi:hypothetical protein